MLKFEKVVKKATSRIRPVYYNDNRCLIKISHLSQCNNCMDVCPVNGINVDVSGIELNDKCIDCGLCTSVCPTGSLYIQEPTELSLYNYIKEKCKKNNKVILTCRQNDNFSSYEAFKVPCLGSLSLEFILGIDLMDSEIDIVFSNEKCGKCMCTRGIDMFLEKIKIAEKIEKDLDLKGGSIKTMEKHSRIKKNKDIHLDEEFNGERREFLSLITKPVKEIPYIAVSYILGTNMGENKSNANYANSAICRYPIFADVFNNIEDKKLANSAIEEYLKPSLVGECNFCRACSNLCPMGAIKYIEKGEELKLVLLENSCSGCGLCSKVCFRNSLELEPKNIEDLSCKKAKILTTGIKKECLVCEKTIKSNKNINVCASCTNKAL